MGEYVSNVETEQLMRKIDILAAAVEKLTAESEIRKLHHKYGYYLDKCLYREVADCFSHRSDSYVQFLNGRFKGRESIERLYIGRFSNVFVGGRNGPIEGWLLDHLMAQDIVDVDVESGIAKARFRTLMSAGTHETLPAAYPGGQRQWWEGGLYENEYIKEQGFWKILRLRYYPFWHGRFTAGWQNCNNFVPLFTKLYPEVENGPDELVEGEKLWPDTRVVPFHYPHPVTGEEVTEMDMRAPKWREDGNTAAPARVINDWLN